MNCINFRSDFSFIIDLVSPDGRPLGIPSCDFSLRLFTASAGNFYEARQAGGSLFGAINDAGRLRVILDSHRLFPGRLHARFTANIPDPLFPDGFRRVEVCHPLGITLTREATSIPSGSLTENLVLPIETEGPATSSPGIPSTPSEGFSDDDINDILNEVLQNDNNTQP